MAGTMHLAFFGALPALFAMAYVDRFDAKRPEPRRTLRRVTWGGAACALPVLAVSRLLLWIAPAELDLAGGPQTYVAALYCAFVVAALPEEAAKLLAVRLFAWGRPEFDERMDGIVYGARAGLGFALIENVAYLAIVPTSFSEYVSVFLGRAILAVPGHATWGAIMGYFAAKRRFDGRGPGLLGGYALATTLHGSYDALLFAAPIAFERGHPWLGWSFLGIPVFVYAIPTAIIGIGAWALHGLARRALAADDAAERAARVWIRMMG